MDNTMTDTTTPDDALHLLTLRFGSPTEGGPLPKFYQSGENPGWFFVVLDPTTVTKVWCEDVPAFLSRS